MKDILKITVSLDGRTIGTLQMTPERDRCVFEYHDWIVKFRHIYDPSDIGKTEYQYMRTDRLPYTRYCTSGTDVSQD